MNPPHQAHAHDHMPEGSPPPTAAPGAVGSRYTCSMHPEIERDAPGKCPLCGMALVPVASTEERSGHVDSH